MCVIIDFFEEFYSLNPTLLSLPPIFFRFAYHFSSLFCMFYVLPENILAEGRGVLCFLTPYKNNASSAIENVQVPNGPFENALI